MEKEGIDGEKESETMRTGSKAMSEKSTEGPSQLDRGRKGRSNGGKRKKGLTKERKKGRRGGTKGREQAQGGKKPQWVSTVGNGCRFNPLKHSGERHRGGRPRAKTEGRRGTSQKIIEEWGGKKNLGQIRDHSTGLKQVIGGRENQ